MAPYAVIRTTAIWNPDSENRRRFALFGPFVNSASDAGQWTSGYALGSNALLSAQVSSADAFRIYNFPSLLNTKPAWSAASVVPAAFSIQVLNPEAVQTTNGNVFIGRCQNKVALAEGTIGLTRTIQGVADDLVSYSNPRMSSAAKLAFQGVHVDAVPNNMSELAKFTTLDQSLTLNQDVTLSASTTYHQDGFNPIFLYNPDAINLQILVCCEWRVRFDPSNPAYAACTYRPPSTDSYWSDMMRRAIAMGNGVRDIVGVVADIGQAASRLPAITGGAQPLPMLAT